MDLGVFILTLEFVDDPAVVLAEAVRVSRRGVLVMALNRWSLGGWSRRWGSDARRPLLGQARDFTPGSLRMLTSAAAGSRLRALRWASALFPANPGRVHAQMLLGDVIGIAVKLGP